MSDPYFNLQEKYINEPGTRVQMMMEERTRKRLQRRAQTTNMWSGMLIFTLILCAILGFAYATIFDKNKTAFWSIVIIIALFMMYKGYKFVKADDGGPQLVGQILGTTLFIVCIRILCFGNKNIFSTFTINSTWKAEKITKSICHFGLLCTGESRDVQAYVW